MNKTELLLYTGLGVVLVYALFSVITMIYNKKHKHEFKAKDVFNTNIDPLCSCGMTLSEARKEMIDSNKSK